MSEEIRVVDPKTGAEKGTKPEAFALIPVEPLEELARVYGMGSKKYKPFNWAYGYSWSLSYSALQRHLNSFWRGEETDPESGLSHLLHAAWHCFTLYYYAKHKVGTDDRQHKLVPLVPADAVRSDAN